MATVADRLLDAIGERDFDGIAACFAKDGTLRAIVPPGVREDTGRGAIADRYRRWLGEEGDYALLERDVAPFADLVRVRYAVRYIDPEAGPVMFEQTAYAEIHDDEVTAMRLACSGDRPA